MNKQIILSMFIWLSVVGISITWNVIDDDKEHRYLALESAKALFNQIVLTRNWNAGHEGVYVPVTKRTQPNPYLKDSLRDVITEEGIRLTKINPAYMTRQVSELATSQNGVQFHITSLTPIRPENKATAWETEWLLAFEEGASEKSTFMMENDLTYFRYMAPLVTEKGCLSCHAVQGYKLGDIRGGISVTMPFSHSLSSMPIIVSHGVVLLIGFFGIVLSGLMLGKSNRILTASNSSKNEALMHARMLSDTLQAKHGELEEGHKALEEAHLKLKETQAQLLQQEKMASVGQLAAGVAHEINNPMGFISSNLRTLEKYMVKIGKYIELQDEALTENKEIKEAKEDLSIEFIIEDTNDLLVESLDGARRVKEIVQNLKSFSRIDEAVVSLSDLNDCIDSTLKIIWNELKYKITVNKKYGDIPSTYCNPQELNQVFMNIIMNATHAIEEKGEITIRSWKDNENLKVSITDTGSGIEPDKIEHIFEPFFTTKEVGKGTGLGLSICYDIVKKHDGEIKVESEVGKGTTFTVILPIKESANSIRQDNVPVH